MRRSRKFDDPLEARGFIRGLRISRDLERIGLRVQNDALEYERLQIDKFFEALDLSAQEGPGVQPDASDACGEGPVSEASPEPGQRPAADASDGPDPGLRSARGQPGAAQGAASEQLRGLTQMLEHETRGLSLGEPAEDE